MKNLLVFFVIITIFFGCTVSQKQYVSQTALFAVEASVMKDQYTKLNDTVRILQKEKSMFTNDEWKLLLEADENINMLYLKFKEVSELKEPVVSLYEINIMYVYAKTSYTTARQVIISKWELFDPMTKARLENFDKQAISIDEHINELMKVSEEVDATKTLNLISGLATIAVNIARVLVI